MTLDVLMVVNVEFRAFRDRADGQCPELSDGHFIDFRERLKMDLELITERARSLVPFARVCRRCSTATTNCSNWSMAFVSVLFVIVSTSTKLSFSISLLLRLQVATAANMKIFNHFGQKSEF